MNDITINISLEGSHFIHIKNELTQFLDKYNTILKSNDKYCEYCETYIYIDSDDIYHILNGKLKTLTFRIPGATRGAIYLTETKRVESIDPGAQSSVEYIINAVEFIDETCFTKLVAYERQVVSASYEHLIGTKVIINILY